MNPDRYQRQQRPYNAQVRNKRPVQTPDHVRPNGIPNAASQSAAASPSADPAASLETLLASFTAHPEAVAQVLGPTALEHATHLLSALAARDKTSTTTHDLFHPRTVQDVPVHPYTCAQPIQIYPAPPLPAIPEGGRYAQAVFTHKSTTTHDRVSGASDLTYEKLEFLGDAYIEIIATRLIFSRYPKLTAGRQAQARERIVKNETLAQFGHAYHFKDRLQASDVANATAKGTTKILADVFEAYVAAIVLSDPFDGFKRAEEWLTELWSPILLDFLGPGEKANAEYNGNAKQELQQKILHPTAKLEYLEDKPMEQSKHEQKYFIGLYLTGYGYDKKKLGYGEGRNKVEAGNRAAMQAFELSADLIDDAARQLDAIKEEQRLKREKKEMDRERSRVDKTQEDED